MNTFTIIFPFSSSVNYESAVAVAGSMASYRCSGEGKKIRHQVDLTDAEVDQLMHLVEYLKGWRNRQVLVNGEEIAWEEALAWTWCYKRRQSAFDPKGYCSGDAYYEINPWGCRRAELPTMSYSGWLSFGRFDQFERWVIDIPRLKHELRIRLHPYRYCPSLKISETWARFESTKPIIDPRKDACWEYVERSVEIGDGWTSEKIGVQPAPGQKAEDLMASLLSSQ